MKKIKLFILIFIFLITLFIIPTKAKAANAFVTISFADNSLYNSVKSQISSKIFSFDDLRKNIVITRDNLLGITFLDLDNQNITDLTGIDFFTNLNRTNSI